MKKFKTLFLGMFLSVTIPSFSTTIFKDSSLVLVELNWQIIDKTEPTNGHPRTPVHVPNLCYDKETNILRFNSPCYECTLEFIISGTETVAFSYSIPDGDDTVLLPDYLTGEYELHIHRGNYCFWGLIELA